MSTSELDVPEALTELETPETVILTYLDLCLKFADYETMHANLYSEVTVTNIIRDPETGEVLETITTVVPNEYKLKYPAVVDDVGTIYKPTLELDVEGNYLTEAIPGYHVNLRGSFIEQDLTTLESFIVIPNSPSQVWA